MRYLSDQDIQGSLEWRKLLSSLEAGYTSLAADQAAFHVPQRVLIPLRTSTYLAMPVVDDDGWFAVKQVAVIPDNRRHGLPTVQAFITLFDTTGRPALAAQATAFTNIRTAAVSAVAASQLAPRGASKLLLIGTGSLAPWMAEGHAQVRPYQRIQVWGRREDGVLDVISRLEERRKYLPGGVEVEPAHDLPKAVREADVICLATTSTSPILHGDWLRGSQHVDAVGAFTPDMAEVAPEVVMSAEVWVDDLESAKAKAGDLLQAQRVGWSFDLISGELSKLVAQGGRRAQDGITLFKSVGTAVSDLIFARQLHGG